MTQGDKTKKLGPVTELVFYKNQFVDIWSMLCYKMITPTFKPRALKPDIGKHPLGCSPHLYGARLINYRAI